MQKLLGACFVITACYFLGCKYVHRKKEMISALKNICHGLGEMSNYIGFQLDELPTIIRSLSMDNVAAKDSFFIRISDSMSKDESLPLSIHWKRTLPAFCKDKDIPKNIEAILEQLGNYIGTSDAESEQIRLQKACSTIESYLIDAEEENQRTNKMFRSLGVLLGTFVVLLLL